MIKQQHSYRVIAEVEDFTVIELVDVYTDEQGQQQQPEQRTWTPQPIRSDIEELEFFAL